LDFDNSNLFRISIFEFRILPVFLKSAMRITVLLGGNLRNEAGEGSQEFELELQPDSRVEDLLPRLGLPQDRIKMIMVNGRGATLDTEISEGNRVALFPPELAFNTFVSLGFRKESVEKRKKQSA
jgi:molybdopterin converting factor small subunit